MGKNGDITITNLKSSTGISDDRLSAHHPNGTGNKTSFGDFLVSNLSGIADGGDPLFDELCKIWDVNGTRRFGTYNSSDFWKFDDTNFELTDGDTFRWVIETTAAGNLYIPQIASRNENWDFATTNAVVDNLKELNNNGSIVGVLVECTVDSPGSAVEVFLNNYGGDLNTDIANYNADFAFRTEDVENTTSSYSVSISATSITNSGGIDVDWSIDNGITPYDYSIERQPRDSSTGTKGTYIEILSGTYNSTSVSDSYSDDNLDDSNDYRYRITVNDGGGTQETDLTSFITVTQ
jgi:hypothetical protein